MFKIRLYKNDFEEALKKLNNLKVGKGLLDELHGVLLKSVDDNVELHRSNIHNYAICKLESWANIGNGEVVIPDSKKLEKSIKNLNCNFIDIEVLKENFENDTIKITGGNKQIKLKAIDAKEFVYMPKELGINKKYRYSKTKLKERIESVEFCKATDETRPALTGMLCRDNDFVATDGYRMAISTDDDLKIENDFILNKDALYFLRRTIKKSKLDNDLVIRMGNHVVFEYDNLILISKTLKFNYFDYEKVLPLNFETLTVNLKALKDNVEFLWNYAKEIKHKIVRLNFEDDKFKMTVNTKDEVVKTENIVKYDNEPIELGLNCKFLRECLKKCKGESVELRVSRGLNPFVVKDRSVKYVILPIRLANSK